MSKLICLILALMLCLSLFGCSDSAVAPKLDPEYVYKQVKLLNIHLQDAATYTGMVSNETRDPINLLFFQATEYIPIKPESYTFDDTGIWYDSSFLNFEKLLSLKPILYNAGSGFTMGRLPFDRNIYDWNTLNFE